jgi:NADPH:quinone reductase-like Zn-dependent oxidoreductase
MHTTQAVGTRVAALASGGYAEYAVASAGAVNPIPDTLDYAHAAAFPLQGLTAYQLLRESARLQPGERVLVHAAAGGVGTPAIQPGARLCCSCGKVCLPTTVRHEGAGQRPPPRAPLWRGQTPH